MINNVSKGQYIGRARDQFLRDGILEIAIPGYCTSTACPAHATVAAAMRNVDRFSCPRCGKVEHAADTIGGYLLLRSLDVT